MDKEAGLEVEEVRSTTCTFFFARSFSLLTSLTLSLSLRFLMTQGTTEVDTTAAGEEVDREGSGGCLAEGVGEEVGMEEEAAVGDDGRSSHLRDSFFSFFLVSFFQPSISLCRSRSSLNRLVCVDPPFDRVLRLSLRAF